MENLALFVPSFLLNIAVAFLIIRGIYYPVRRDNEYVLTFFAFNTSVFLIATLFQGVDLSVGFGFGLFAIFSVLRYRTEPIPVREMTYLFIVMALPVVNAILFSQGNVVELLAANTILLALLYAVERGWGFQREIKKTITYEKIELIRPENRERLLADLRERTGLPVTRCEVGRIDFLRDTAQIDIYYTPPRPQPSAQTTGPHRRKPVAPFTSRQD